MTVAQIIGLVVVLLLTIAGGIFIGLKSKNHSLLKWTSLFLFLAICLTWIFQYGSYTNGQYTSNGEYFRIGLSNLPNMLYYAISFAADKIVFLLTLGAFYAVLSRCEGYKKLVTSIASKFKGGEVVVVVLASLFFTIMTAFLNQTFASLIFVPFVISIILHMNMDRLTAFLATFGAILVGVIGSVYGTESLYWFGYYTGAAINSGILYRVIVLVVTAIIYNVFNVLHVLKVMKGKKVNELESDPYEFEKVSEKAHTWPIIVIFVIIFIFMILGYISWSTTFGITIFSDFHKSLVEFNFGSTPVLKSIFGDMPIFSAIFGSLIQEFGQWDMYLISIILCILGALSALMCKVKFDDFLTACGEGIGKIAKCVGMFILIYIIMMAVYFGMSMPTINNLIVSKISHFNPYITTVMAFLSSIFQTDLGLTGFTVGSYYVTTYATNTPLIQLIFTTMYGLVQFIAPTSAMLVIGLSYLKIDYKSWIKYIWMFAVLMLILLVLLFTVIQYVHF